MRHNRRAVMAEHYKLYMKKNVFNGRYFVRNMQIAFCALIVCALIATVVVLVGSNNDGKKTAGANKEINVKEALFGNNEVTEAEITATTETVMAVAEENVTEEATSESTDITTVSSEEVVGDITSTAAVESTTEAETEEVAEKEEKSEFDNRCIANVEETLNIRKEPSTDAEFVGSMTKGSIATVEGKDGEWTKIKSGDVEGYVLSEYVLTGKVAEAFSQDYVTIQGTAKEDGVNIRKERSTDSDILKVLDKDDTVSVIEEPEAEKKEDKTSETSKVSYDKKETTADNADNNSTEEATESVTGDSTVESLTADSTEAAVESVTESTTETIAEGTTENTTEASTESTTENTTEDTTKIVAENTTEDTTKKVTENTTEDTTEKSTKKDDINWITVMLDDGQVGYVSQDYIEVDKLYTLAVSAEELQRREEERLAAERAAAEEAARLAKQQAEEEARASQAAASTTASSNSGSSSSYQGAKTTPVTATESGESLGKFYITAYCGCSKCSGGHNKTASGTTPTQGRTIAADTSVLPFGTQVVIDGVVYTVEDRGSGVCGNHIDIFFATHEDALAFGSKTVTVYKY